MAEFIQPSFSSGEIAPAAHGRVDLAKYQTALKTCRNFLTRVHGGVVNRPGTEFIAESDIGRFLPFIFNESQSYVLDFRNLALQIVKDGGYVLETSKAFTVNTSNPPTFTCTNHGFVNNDQVFITNSGMAEINNQFWAIVDVGVHTFRLVGLNVAGSGGTGTVARSYRTVSPYPSTLFPKLTHAQLRDVITLAVSDLSPKNLSRTDHNVWTFNEMPFQQGPFQDVNADITKQMSINAVTGTITISANFNAFTIANVGQLIYLEQLNYGAPWEVGKSVTAGDLRRSEGRYYSALDSGTTGTLRPSGEVVGAFESDGTIRWQYKHSGYGIAIITQYLSATSVVAAVILEMPVDLTTAFSFKWALGAWGGDQGWPAAVTYFQQRRVLASTPARPEGIWLSGTNAFDFFGKSTPIQDDDAISIQLIGDKINAVRYMLQLGKLVVLTVGGKWVLPDDDNNPVLTPGHRSARQQGSVGIAQVPPSIVEDSILYVVEKGQTVQDLAYQFVSNAYAGKDLSVLSKHLFEGYTIVAAAYQHVPFQVYWMVRNDGILISCTYLREHEVWGFHHHDMQNGFVEDVCVIPEGAEDRVYFRVRRVINGVTKRYTERLASRLYSDIRDAFFVDCGVKYDGRNKTSRTMQITARPSAGSGFGEGGFGEGGFGGSGTITSNFFEIRTDTDYFVNAHLTDEIHVDYQGRTYKFRITSILDAKNVSTKSTGVEVPLAILNIALTEWVHAKITLNGFKHLEGETVSVLADGKVHPQVVIEGYKLRLQYAAGVIVAGLQITADFETLNLNAPAQGSILDRLKSLFAVRLLVDESRGIFAGPNADNLDELAQREDENYDAPVNLKTGVVAVRVAATWEPGGRVFIRQSDPLPLSIIGVMPDVDIGGAL